jgi:hypothetical protein
MERKGIMNNAFGHKGNVPIAFNPGLRHGHVAAVRGAPKANLPQDRLIVGVDFGTTYSGVAAVYSCTPDDIDIIKTWPGGNGNKLPSTNPRSTLWVTLPSSR